MSFGIQERTHAHLAVVFAEGTDPNIIQEVITELQYDGWQVEYDAQQRLMRAARERKVKGVGTPTIIQGPPPPKCSQDASGNVSS